MIPNNIKDVPKAMINGFPDEYKDRLKSHIKIGRIMMYFPPY